MVCIMIKTSLFKIENLFKLFVLSIAFMLSGWLFFGMPSLGFVPAAIISALLMFDLFMIILEGVLQHILIPIKDQWVTDWRGEDPNAPLIKFHHFIFLFLAVVAFAIYKQFF